MKNGWQVPLAVLVTVILFAAFKAKPMDSAADIAAWVQGIGSLIAIIAAVGIYAKQYADKIADDEAETVAFVQAMRHEIEVIWEEYTDIRRALLATPQHLFYSAIVPLYTDSLIVYSRSPERVGKIDDDALRALIVRMYTGLRGHLNSLRQNNALVEDYEQLYRVNNSSTQSSTLQRQSEVMREYTAGLKRADSELEKLVTRFMVDTEAWLRRQSGRAR